MFICPHCQIDNQDTALICINCKQPLERITQATRGTGGPRSKIDSKHRLHLGKLPDYGVAIYIGKSEQPIILTLTSKLILGRRRDAYEPNMLDFTPYDGYKYGMSRHHAALFFKDGALCIQDTGSANGTWVSTMRLQPYSIVALIPGVVVSLAQLAIHIYY